MKTLKTAIFLGILSVACALECDPNPCENSGTCHSVAGYDNFQCTCASDFTGNVCEIELLRLTTPHDVSTFTFVTGDPNAALVIDAEPSGAWSNVDVTVTTPTGGTYPMTLQKRHDTKLQYVYAISNVSEEDVGAYTVVTREVVRGVTHQTKIAVNVSVIDADMVVSPASPVDENCAFYANITNPDEWDSVKVYMITEDNVTNLEEDNEVDDAKHKIYCAVLNDTLTNVSAVLHIFVAYFTKGNYSYKIEEFLGKSDETVRSDETTVQTTQHELVIGETGFLPLTNQTTAGALDFIVATPDHILHIRNASLEAQETSIKDAGVYTVYDVQKKTAARILVKAVSFFVGLLQDIVIVSDDTASVTVVAVVITNAGFENIKTNSTPEITVNVSETEVRYEFQIIGPFAQTNSYDLDFTLTMSERSVTKRLKVTAVVLESNITVIRGGSGFSYTCTDITGDKALTWEKDGIKVSTNPAAGVTHDGNGTITFQSSVRYRDAGIYVCTKESGDAISAIQVIVEGFPEVIPASDETVPFSNTIESFCAIKSNPAANITWKLNNGIIPGEILASVVYRTGDDNWSNSTLVLNQTLCLGPGVISCEAENIHGTTKFSRKNFTINSDTYGVFGSGYIVFPPSSTEIPSDICEAFGGKTVTITRDADYFKNGLKDLAGNLNISEFRVDLKGEVGCLVLRDGDGGWIEEESKCDGNISPACRVQDETSPSNLILSHGECPETSIKASWHPGMGKSQDIELSSTSLEHPIVKVVSLTTTEWSVDNLTADTLYHLTVSTQRSHCRFHPDVQQSIRTAGIAPDLPIEVSMSTIDGLHCQVRWNYGSSEDQFFQIEVNISEKINRIGCGLNATGETRWGIRVNSTVSSKTFKMSPNSKYSVVIKTVSCSSNGSSAVVNGSCESSVAAPESIVLENVSEDLSINETEDVEVFLYPTNNRNGPVSCVFVVVQLWNGTEATAISVTEAEFQDIKSSSETSIEEGDKYFAYAVSGCDLQGAMSFRLGDDERTQCSPSEQTGSRRKREAGDVIGARNRPLRALQRYTYYILTTTPDDAGGIKFATSRMSPFFEVLTVPVSVATIVRGTVDVTNRVTEVNRSARSTLHCSGDGDPIPDITWSLSGVKMTTDSSFAVYQTGSELVFSKGVSYSESGVYECTATNDDGANSATSSIDVTVVGKPESVGASSIKETVVGFQEREITCNFTGVPRPTVTWSLDDLLLSNSAVFSITETVTRPYETSSTLRITDSALCLGPATVKCTAENKHGEKSQGITINDFEYDVIGDQYIIFTNTLTTYHTANDSCNSKGGILLDIEDIEEEKEITELADTFGVSEFSIGSHFANSREGCPVMKNNSDGWSWSGGNCGELFRLVCGVAASFLPKSLSVTPHECMGDKITVNWSTPFFRPGVNVFLASGRSSVPAATEETDENLPPIVLADLAPNTPYVVEISTVPEFCRLRPYATRRVTTGSLPPKEPDQVTIEPISATTCEITWNYDEALLSSLTNFSITVSQEKTAMSSDNVTSTIFATRPKNTRNYSMKIETDLKYRATVSAVSRCGSSTAVEASGVCVRFSDGLSGGAYLAIFLPIVAILCLIIIIMFIFCYWKRRRKAPEPQINGPKNRIKVVSETVHQNPTFSNDYITDPTCSSSRTKEPKSSYQPQNLYVNLDSEDDVFYENEAESDYIHGKVFDDLEIND